MSTRRSATRRLVPVLALGASVACDDDSTEPDATTEEQVAYIDQIVPHHEVASMRADEALTKAVHEGLEAMGPSLTERTSAAGSTAWRTTRWSRRASGTR
jgi:uncharacterized protein (DUF305 family)